MFALSQSSCATEPDTFIEPIVYSHWSHVQQWSDGKVTPYGESIDFSDVEAPEDKESLFKVPNRVPNSTVILSVGSFDQILREIENRYPELPTCETGSVPATSFHSIAYLGDHRILLTVNKAGACGEPMSFMPIRNRCLIYRAVEEGRLQPVSSSESLETCRSAEISFLSDAPMRMSNRCSASNPQCVWEITVENPFRAASIAYPMELESFEIDCGKLDSNFCSEQLLVSSLL